MFPSLFPAFASPFTRFSLGRFGDRIRFGPHIPRRLTLPMGQKKRPRQRGSLGLETGWGQVLVRSAAL